MMIYDFRFEPMLVEGVIIYETTLYCNCREYVYMLQLKFGNKGVENYAYKALHAINNSRASDYYKGTG